MAISMVRAKALCSASELALVKASTRQEIGGHTAAQLRLKESRSRKLRDKWCDLAKSQKRSTQAKVGSRDADYNKNSAEKAALFDEVLGRFSAQLAKQEAAGKTPGPVGRQRPTKTARSRTHRAARAETRSELAEAKSTLKTAAPASVKKPKPAAPKIKAAAEPAATVMAPAVEPKRKSKRPQPAVGVHTTALEAGRKAQGLRITKQTQLAARTAAKQDRMKASGLVRIQKNRSAANKRSQGRRDSR
jgi:hypothetical protein